LGEPTLLCYNFHMGDYIAKLSGDYISVDKSYGGSQIWFRDGEKGNLSRDNIIKGYGCGLIGASDILMYIGAVKKPAREKIGIGKRTDELGDVHTQSMTTAEYKSYIHRMEKLYFHIYPKLGMSGIMLMLGMNLYLLMHGREIKRETGRRFRARWGVRPTRIYESIEKMLAEEIPVIIAIGPGYFSKRRLRLYGVKPAATKAHYVTVTGIRRMKREHTSVELRGPARLRRKLWHSLYRDDDIYLEVSSWGRRYCISWNEYIDYVLQCDNFLFSNILYIGAKS